MKPVVVFDLGKVLVDFDYSSPPGKSPRERKSPVRNQAVIAQSRFIMDYESGQLTRPDFFKQVQAATGFGGNLDEFGGFFADIFTSKYRR